jgi:transmembrane sensor
MRENADSIDAAAAEWVVRIDRCLTDSERTALEEWLSADPRRTGALARAQAGWVYMDRSQVYRAAGELRELRTARPWRMAMPWASAAAVLVAVATALWAWQGYSRTHFATSRGEVRQLNLADGSRITLDTLSRVSVRYESATRLVRLEAGEALFDVAKDPGRPFIVQAGNVRVRAVGTAFVVDRRSDASVDVIVTHGTVDVWREASSPEPAVRVAARKRLLTTPVHAVQPEELTADQLAGAIAWEHGVIDLNGRTIAEAAAEFNRYNARTIVIRDPALASQTVVGQFQTADPVAFVTAAAAMLDAHVRTDGDRLILESGPSAQK